MKKNLLLLTLFIMVSFYINAQENSSGKVIYNEVTKLELTLEGEAAQFASMLPSEQKSRKVLYFSPEATLFENDNSAVSEDISMQAGEGHVMIRMTEPENKIYTNLSKKTQTEQREFMTRTFLIEGEIRQNWKLTGQQKIILEYPCQEAVLVTENDTVSAWFTPAIPVSAGPAKYCGLPGLILAVSSSNGKKSTTALSVDFSSPSKNMIQEPEKGKKITREQYEKMVEEKTKEMGVEQHGNAHIVIGVRR